MKSARHHSIVFAILSGFLFAAMFGGILFAFVGATELSVGFAMISLFLLLTAQIELHRKREAEQAGR